MASPPACSRLNGGRPGICGNSQRPSPSLSAGYVFQHALPSMGVGSLNPGRPLLLTPSAGPRTRAKATFGVRAALIGALVSAATSTSSGQLPQPPIGVLDHTVWTIRDGAPSGLRALVQSADGVLWIGATTGLYRFDGVRFEQFQPPGSQRLPSLWISTLLALPDTTLWIGYSMGGLSVLARGRLVSYSRQDGLPDGTAVAIARDSSGDMWVATTTGLARLHSGRWQQIAAERGYPGGMTVALLMDRRGTLWAAAHVGVFTLRRGATRFVRQAPPLDREGGGFGVLREAPDGSIWGSSTTLGLTRLSDTAGRQVPARMEAEGVREAWDLAIDRHRNAWISVPSGLVRVSLAGIDDQALSNR